jgi:hypothetical protein
MTVGTLDSGVSLGAVGTDPRLRVLLVNNGSKLSWKGGGNRSKGRREL